MRTILLVGLGLAALAPARAQVFGPAAVNGAFLGGIAGGIIGHNSGRGNGWAGAAIGASAGLILGSAVDAERTYIDRDPPEAVYDSGYSTYYTQPNYALTSTVVGGVLGGVIGNNSGHRNGWAGAAIGAGLGYLIGSAAERPVVRGYYVRRAAPALIGQPAVQVAPAAPVAPARPMDAANSLFGRS